MIVSVPGGCSPDGSTVHPSTRKPEPRDHRVRGRARAAVREPEQRGPDTRGRLDRVARGLDLGLDPAALSPIEARVMSVWLQSAWPSATTAPRDVGIRARRSGRSCRSRLDAGGRAALSSTRGVHVGSGPSSKVRNTAEPALDRRGEHLLPRRHGLTRRPDARPPPADRCRRPPPRVPSAPGSQPERDLVLVRVRDRDRARLGGLDRVDAVVDDDLRVPFAVARPSRPQRRRRVTTARS
jgi:hypothetical protein